MTVDVRFNEEAGVVEMTFAAAPAPQELEAAMTQAGALGAEMLTSRYLVDCRDVSTPGSAFDILAVAELLSSIPPGVIEREAVLLPRDAAAAEDFKFFETACRNRGLDVRVFHDRGEALAWVGL
jgi:hypothetical protein